MENVMQGVSLAGAGLILGAYTLLQVGRLGRDNASFHLMNLVGSVLLSAVALYEVSWGFIVLETVWAALSLGGWMRARSAPRAAGA